MGVSLVLVAATIAIARTPVTTAASEKIRDEIASESEGLVIALSNDYWRERFLRGETTVTYRVDERTLPAVLATDGRPIGWPRGVALSVDWQAASLLRL